MTVHIVRVDEAPRKELRYGRGVVLRLADGDVGARFLDLHINVVRANTPPGPYHYHSNAENAYLILEGTARLIVEGIEHVVGPDHAVFIPPGVKHSVSNAGPGELRLIEIYAPANPDFHEMPA